MPNMIACPHCSATGDCAKCALPDRSCSWCADSGQWDCQPLDRERAPQGEAMSLFTPAPNQMPGQMTF